MSRSTDARAAALDLAEMLPAPGEWSAQDYLWLTGRTNQLVELADGWLEVLPMPSERHQRILLLLRDAADARRGERFWTGADLVVEVLSPDDPERDLVVKRAEYAAAGIGEYWIVDPERETVTVLALASGSQRAADYVERGAFGRGARVTSRVLPGLGFEAASVFDEEP